MLNERITREGDRHRRAAWCWSLSGQHLPVHVAIELPEFPNAYNDAIPQTP